MRTHVCLLVLATLLLSPASAWAARWDYFTVGDGLPSNIVVDMLQSSDGSVWVGTRTGLARYDGAWTVIAPERINAVAVGAEGDVWAVGDNLLVHRFTAGGDPLHPAFTDPGEIPGTPGYSPDIRSLTMRQDGTLEQLRGVAVQPDGTVWMGTPEALRTATASGAMVDGRPEYIIEFVYPPSESHLIESIHVDAMGDVWWGETDRTTEPNAAGYGKMIDGVPTFFGTPDPQFTASAITVLQTLSDGGVVLGTRRGNVWWAAGAGATPVRIEQIEEAPSGKPVNDMGIDALGRVWVARENMYRLDPGDSLSTPLEWDLKIFGDEDGVNGSAISYLEVDDGFLGRQSRSQWFGTSSGISILTDLRWTTYTLENGIGGGLCGLGGGCSPDPGNCSVITSVALDPARDVVWLGSGRGLSRFSGGEWTGWVAGKLNAVCDGVLVEDGIRSLHVDDAGTVFLASGEQAPIAASVEFHVHGDPDEQWYTLGTALTDGQRWSAYDIETDAEGWLWLATDDGAWRLNLDVDTIVAEEQFTDAQLPTTLRSLTAHGNQMFVGGLGGAARYDLNTGSWTALPLEGSPFSSEATVAALEVVDDQLYLSTDEGLLVVPASDNSLAGATALGANEGFATDVREVAPFRDATVLAATDNGIYRVRAQELSTWSRIGSNEGLPNENVLAIATDGARLWAGTLTGAATHIFSPPETSIESQLPILTSGGVPVEVDVTVVDPDSDPRLAQFEWRFGDGPWRGPATLVQFVPELEGLPDGMNTLSVRAIDPQLNRDPTPAMQTFELDTQPPVPLLAVPSSGGVVQDQVTIRGRVNDARFRRYRIDVWRSGMTIENATTILDWVDVLPQEEPLTEPALANWNTRDFSDDLWALRLTLEDELGIAGYTQIEVLVDNEFPFAGQTSPVTVLGETGATVHSANDGAILYIPAQAFSGESTVRIDRVDVPEAADGVGARVTFDGDEVFGLERTLTLQLRASSTAEEGEPLAIFRLEDSEWVRLGGTREAGDGGGLYSVAIDYPGTYALRTGGSVAAGGTVISALATEPRYFSPRSGGFEGHMSISFSLGRASSVNAMVYNRAGRLRRKMVEGLSLGPGSHVLTWDGRDHEGELVAGGLYIVCVEADDERVTKVVSVGHR